MAAEGGHSSFAPADAFEAQVLQAAWASFDHVSAERLISGTGLPLLHQAVCQVLGLASTPTLTADAIVTRGVQGSDEGCSHTVDTFCAMLGGFAGNVALTMGARGGMFIGGGIVPRMGERFFASRFRQRFEAKGRYQPYMQRIGTVLIVDTLAALSGVAAAVKPRFDRAPEPTLKR
jgi:glucokinase